MAVSAAEAEVCLWCSALAENEVSPAIAGFTAGWNASRMLMIALKISEAELMRVEVAETVAPF